MKEIERAFKLMLTEYPDVLTVQEVAKILGCDDHQIYKMTILIIGGGTIAYFYTCIIEVKQFKQIK